MTSAAAYPLVLATLLSFPIIGLALNGLVRASTRLFARARYGSKYQNQLLKLQLLNAQIKPHFLFNCLNSINNYIVRSQSREASEYLAQFSKLMRLMLENLDEEQVTLSREMEYLELYLKMEQLRVNNRFSYCITIHDSINPDQVLIPPMILQPFVENSIWHGFHTKLDHGLLSINVSPVDVNLVRYTIEDDGSGRTDSRCKSKRFGMRNTTQRLKVLYGHRVNNPIEVIDLQDKTGRSLGTKIVLTLPLETKLVLPAFQRQRRSPFPKYFLLHGQQP